MPRHTIPVHADVAWVFATSLVSPDPEAGEANGITRVIASGAYVCNQQNLMIELENGEWKRDILSRMLFLHRRVYSV